MDNIIRSLGIKIHVPVQEQPSLLTKVQNNKFVTKIQQSFSDYCDHFVDCVVLIQVEFTKNGGMDH